jgi:hypothetical protein
MNGGGSSTGWPQSTSAETGFGGAASRPSGEGGFASMIASELAMATNFTGIDHMSKVKAQASCAPRSEAAARSSPDRRDGAPNPP